MSEYLIRNGHVFDPVQGIKGDKKDIAVKDDKIVDKVSSSAKVIDAKDKTVIAGALRSTPTWEAPRSMPSAGTAPRTSISTPTRPP